jgi:YfiH family protein
MATTGMNIQKPVQLTFQGLSRIPTVAHGFFTRHGGVSGPPYESLNVGWNDGDRREHVEENLLRVKQSLGLGKLVSSLQVHGDTINVVDEAALAHAQSRFPVLITSPGDALVTSLRGVGLMIKVADCQAIFLVDPVREVIANIHCGWRGSVNEFPGKVVRFLTEKFGCRPEELLASIGPSLGPCCAEFKNYRQELPRSFWDYQSKQLYFDFWSISRRQLLDAGLKSESIEVAGRCTVCESDLFFSYRGQGRTGRMAAVIALK